MNDQEPKPFFIQAGNTTQTLAPTDIFTIPDPTPPTSVWLGETSIRPRSDVNKPSPPPEAPEPEFAGENLGLAGPGSIDGHNRIIAQEVAWWKDTFEAIDKGPDHPASQTSMMGLLLDRIERLEDWRDTLDAKIAAFNIRASHRI